MTPVYFPLTYVPQWVAETLAAWFRQFAVYRPTGRKIRSAMKPWVDSDILEIRAPVPTDDQIMDRVIKNFRSFADLHDEGKRLKTAAFIGQQGEAPFFDETAISQIVQDVKKNAKSEPPAESNDPLFFARVFLELAHQFDRQNDELNRGVGDYDHRIRDLLKNLRGSNEIEASPVSIGTENRPGDSGEYMPLRRLQAWSRLFMEDPSHSGVFVTSSPSVFNYLADNLSAVEKIVQKARLPVIRDNIDASPDWRSRFLKQIQRLVEGQRLPPAAAFAVSPLPGDHRSNVALTLFRAPGQRPTDLFYRVLKNQNIDARRPKPRAEFTNTLVGLIGPSDEVPFH